MLSGAEIPFGLRAATDLAHCVQGLLTQVALEGAPAFVLRALPPERTRGTDLLGRRVVKAVAVGVQRFGFQPLAGRTAIGIRRRVIRYP